MNELIQQARELCEKATPGPWKPKETADYSEIYDNHSWGKALNPLAMVGSNLEDAAFIAASRTLVPRLCDALEAAEKRIAELEAAQRWISVGERLPDDAGSYLVYYHEWSNGDFLPKYDDYRIRVMRFVNNGKWCMPVCTDKRCEADTNREVTHWQKLPHPPQKG